MDKIFQHLSESNQLWQPCQSTAAKYVDVSEIWHGCDTLQATSTRRKIMVEELGKWLNGGEKKYVNDEIRSCVLRIVWIEYDPSIPQNNISDTALRSIIDSFDLTLANGYFRTWFAGAATLPLKRLPTRTIRSYSFSYHPKLAFIWSRDTTANRIQGICFALPTQIAYLRESLDTVRQLADQEMIIAFLCSLLLTAEADRSQDMIKKEVREIEVRTGYHQWSSRTEQAAPGDLARISAKISGCATKTASTSRKIKVIQQLNEFILENLQQIPTCPVGVSPTAQQISSATDNVQLLQSYVQLLQTRAKMQQVDTDFFLHRIDVQISAVCISSVSKTKRPNRIVANASERYLISFTKTTPSPPSRLLEIQKPSPWQPSETRHQ